MSAVPRAQSSGGVRRTGDEATSDCSAGRCRDGWRCGYHEHVYEVALRLTIEEERRAR